MLCLNVLYNALSMPKSATIGFNESADLRSGVLEPSLGEGLLSPYPLPADPLARQLASKSAKNA